MTHLLIQVAPIQEGSRFVAVVPPKMTHYLLMPNARIQEGGRFAAVCSNSQHGKKLVPPLEHLLVPPPLLVPRFFF